MRRTLTVSTTAIALVVLAKVAFAGPPVGVAPATIVTGLDCYFSTLASGPGVTPIPIPGNDLGQVLVRANGSTRVVSSNSANGSINLSCHGNIEFGSTVTGYDPVTFAEIGPVTVGAFDEACAVLEQAGYPDVCRGNGTAIVTTGSTGGRCFVAEGLVTSKWHAITTPSGQVTVRCHYPE
jgi:hypothetical protein